MLLNPSGKELFWELCTELNKLKLVIDEEKIQKDGRVESVPFFFHEDIKQEGNNKKLKFQVAAVQYNGGQNRILNNEITGVTLRIYIAPLSVFNLERVLEKHTEYRSALKGPTNTPYYDYIFDEPYLSEDIRHFVDNLFADLNKEFLHTFNPIQDNLILINLPEGIKELPRY